MLTELHRNAGMQLWGSITHHQSWQCRTQASFAQDALAHFHTAPLCVTLTQPWNATKRGYSHWNQHSLTRWGGLQCVLAGGRQRRFWPQKIKEWLIRTGRGLKCLNSPVPFRLTQVCAQHISVEELQIVSFQWLQEHPDGKLSAELSTTQRRAKPSCRYPPFGNSSFTLHTEEARRSTHASDHQTSRQAFLMSRNYLQYSLKTKLCHSRKFHTWKMQFQNFFYLPCFHCAFISLANWLRLPHIFIKIFTLTCMVCCS